MPPLRFYTYPSVVSLTAGPSPSRRRERLLVGSLALVTGAGALPEERETAVDIVGYAGGATFQSGDREGGEVAFVAEFEWLDASWPDAQAPVRRDWPASDPSKSDESAGPRIGFKVDCATAEDSAGGEHLRLEWGSRAVPERRLGNAEGRLCLSGRLGLTHEYSCSGSALLAAPVTYWSDESITLDSKKFSAVGRFEVHKIDIGHDRLGSVRTGALAAASVGLAFLSCGASINTAVRYGGAVTVLPHESEIGLGFAASGFSVGFSLVCRASSHSWAQEGDPVEPILDGMDLESSPVCLRTSSDH